MIKIYKKFFNNNNLFFIVVLIFSLLSATFKLNEASAVSTSSKVSPNNEATSLNNLDVCPICLEELENDKYFFITRCNHKFHENCFKKKEKKLCPACRGTVSNDQTSENFKRLLMKRKEILSESYLEEFYPKTVNNVYRESLKYSDSNPSFISCLENVMEIYVNLQNAVISNNIENVKNAIAIAAKKKLSKNFIWNSLFLASEFGYLEIVKYFIRIGINANVFDENGYSSLHYSSKSGHIEIVLFLIENGANVNASSRKGYTPLYSASEKGHLDIVKLLVRKGAKINIFASFEFTPLLTAITYGHIEVAKFLIKNGANVNDSDQKGMTPLRLAKLSKYEELVCLLIEKGAIYSVRKTF